MKATPYAAQDENERVRIMKPGPFKGLCGTIQRVTVMCDEGKSLVCWYLIRLDVRTKPV